MSKPEEHPYGRIISPKSGDILGQSFVVSGELQNIPEKDHIWLAVEIGNLMWIKEPEIPSSDRRWNKGIAEGSNPPGGFFSLSLIQVSSKGQHFIQDWLNHGKKTGDFTGIDGIPGANKLDIVDNLRIR